MLGKRRHIRVKGNFQIWWCIENQSIEGEGFISNISMTGFEMMTRRVFNLPKGSILLLEPLPGEITPLQSKKAKVMWSEKIVKDEIEWMQVGLEFIKS
jgi:hypothetical protein